MDVSEPLLGQIQILFFFKQIYRSLKRRRGVFEFVGNLRVRVFFPDKADLLDHLPQSVNVVDHMVSADAITSHRI